MRVSKHIEDKFIRAEEKTSCHINILTHYDDETLLDKSDKLIKIIKLSGVDFITKDDQTLDILKNRRNSLLKSFSSEFAVYFWTIRRKGFDYPEGEFKEGFAKEVNEKYKSQMKKSALFQNHIYMAVMTKPPEGVIQKGFNIFKQLSFVADKKAKQVSLAKRKKELDEMTRKIVSTLKDYHPETLSVYEKNGIAFSQPLEVLSQIINYDKNTIPLGIYDASQYLPTKRFFFNRRAGVMEMRDAQGKTKFAAMLAIKNYSSMTYQGIFDDLYGLNIEYTITQSFRFYDKHHSKTRLRDQQNEMAQTKDESISQTAQIDETYDDAASGEVGIGSHHFSLVCYANSIEELNKNVGIIIARFSDLDIVCVKEDVASECTYWAQLPGNFGYIVRAADISTKNMAAFASLHNFEQGKIKGNHWGDAVTVLETVSGSPYYFNFHYKDVGNFLTFGAMGSGKTVLIGFLILQSMKFGGKRIIFDKDRGLEILVRAMGGGYEIIKPGKPTGFNPCQVEDTPENRKFLSSLFRKMLSVTGEPLTESDISVVDSAIDGMYRLDKSKRQLCHIASFFGAKRKDSLRSRFDQWQGEGTNAWLFDNEIDSMNFNYDVLGFDMGFILDDEHCKTPAVMYLMYRISKILEGERGIVFGDEGWKLLDDDYFKEILEDKSRTERKKNNVLGLATQIADDTANSTVSKAINESSFCKIFFPNPSARREIYMESFGLTEHEFHIIKTLPDDKNFFLLNFGRSVNKQSVVVRANLSGMENEVAVISARENTLKILDDVIQECGDIPSAWLPVFHERRKSERAKL